MRMHLALAATIFGAAFLAAPAGAQEPAPDYVLPGRLYHYYLTSPYSFRTYSSLGSARSWGFDTPYESSHYYQPPGYYHEETTPYTRWGHAVIPPTEGQTYHRPVVVYPPYPGYYPYPPP